MKKFISALSSLVLTATAMGGSLAMTASADYSKTIGGTVASTILQPKYYGDDASKINDKGNIVAKAGDTVPIAIYIPQSSGFYSLSFKMSFNGDETLGKGTETDPDGKVITNHPDSYGNYGIELKNHAGLNDAYPTPYCLDSGNLYYDEDYPDDDNGGNPTSVAFASAALESYTILYVAKPQLSRKEGSVNIDSYDAWVDAGSPSVLEWTPVCEWTEKESASWKTNHPFVVFDAVLPKDLPDGTYTLGMLDSYVPYSDFFKPDNQKTKNDSAARGFNTVGDNDGVLRKLEFKPLTIQVGESTGTSKTSETSKTETSQTSQTSKTENSAAPEGTVVYDLKAKGKDNTFNGTNNVANVTAGEEVTIEWYVSNDPGTAGMEYSLSFPKCEYVSGKTGKAYSANPEFNDDDKDDIRYVFATKAVEVGRTDRPIASFTVKAPSADGDYEVGFTGIKARTVDLEGAVIKTVLHNLVLHVGEAGGSTTEGSKTTETSKTTSDKGQTTTVKEGTVVYDLKAKGKDNTFNGKNNVANVTAGEEVTIEWYVSNDPGTAGMEYSLSFPKCEYVSGKTGKAYSANPEFNDDDKDDIRYVFATKATEVGRTDRPIASFTVKAPSADGDYEVGFTGIKARTVDLEGAVIEAVLHNLVLHVGEAGGSTTPTTPTTSETSGTTTTQTTPTSKTDVPVGDILWGDVNCDKKVSIADVVLLNKHIAQQAPVSDQGKKNADCEFDGKLDSKDSLKIKQYLALLIKYEALGEQK